MNYSHSEVLLHTYQNDPCSVADHTEFEGPGAHIRCPWEYIMVEHLENIYTDFLFNIKYVSAIWSIHSTPRELPRKNKTDVYTETCTLMFIESWLIIASNWKPALAHPPNGQRNRGIHPVEGWSPLESNKLLKSTTTWMHLKIRRYRSWTQRSIYSIIPDHQGRRARWLEEVADQCSLSHLWSCIPRCIHMSGHPIVYFCTLCILQSVLLIIYA